MNGGHQTPLHAEVLIENFDDGSKAVGGAAGVAEDVPILMAVLVVIDANHKGAHPIALTRSREDHFFRASLDMHAGFFIGVENAGGFDHQINAPIFPRAVEGVPISKELDFLAVDDHRVIRGLDVDRRIQATQNGVVGEQVSTGFGIRCGVHPHNFQTGICPTADPTPQNIATNPAESIDRNAQGHRKSGVTA